MTSKMTRPHTSKPRGPRRGQEGFTLIEIIISLVILAIISIGFVQLVSGNLSVLGTGYDYDQASYEMINALESDVAPPGISLREIKDLNLNLSNDNAGVEPDSRPEDGNHRLSVREVEVYYTEAEKEILGTFRYFLPQETGVGP